jgi:uncharacterized Zn finger protein
MAKRRGYWGYYYTPAAPKTVKDGIKTKSTRGSIGETWWSKRWIGVLESFNMGARLTRGRSYARQGQVISIDVEAGLVTSAVQGTRSKPYAVKIRLKPISKRDWDKVTEAMAAQAIFAAKLLSGEMPTNIEEAFHEVKIPLFPTSKRELKTECSCPDWANPCKHIAAVYYLLAERFDEDPFLIFKLRGRTKDEIVAMLREKRAQKLPSEINPSTTEADSKEAEEIVPLEECLETFWQAGEALDTFAVHIVAPEVDKAILKRLGDAPFMVKDQNLTALLSKAYDAVTTAALKKASEDESDI